MRFILSIICVLAISFGAFGQAPGIRRQPLTTNQHFGPLPSDGHVPIWNATAGKWSNNIIVGGGGGSSWTNEAGYYRLVGGSTNSLKVMTNGLMGIAIGDENIMSSFWGWPYAGLTFINFLDGSPDHELNGMLHGVIDDNGSGAYMDLSASSGASPIFNTLRRVDTNGVAASRLWSHIDKLGGFLTISDGTFDNNVSLRSGTPANGSGGTNLISARWNGQARFTVDTNGNATSKTFTLLGTTNQVIFGATNLPPSSVVVPSKWISVQVSGEATVYLLPLYQ